MMTASVNEVDYGLFGEVSAQPVSKIRKLIAKNMTASWTIIPHVTHHDEVDISAVEKKRRQLNDSQEKVNDRTHYTILPFILKAIIKALKNFPEFNASLNPQADTLIIKHYYHLGIAVDTANGLIVPVLKDADRLSLAELSSAVEDLAERTRSGHLTFAETEGSSFSITSLGPSGGTSFTPIIKTPEVAILGVSRILNKVIADNGKMLIRPILPLSLSYDHRVIDGAMAARFMTYLRHLLSDSEALLE